MHQDLLSRIGQGQVSLLSMEPPHYGAKEGLVTEWIRRQQETSMLEPRGILEDCFRSFNKQFSDFPEEKWTFQVIKELASMQFSLQTQPCMMEQYRRFVVITGKQDKIASDWSGVSFHFYFFPHSMKDLTGTTDYAAGMGQYRCVQLQGRLFLQREIG